MPLPPRAGTLATPLAKPWFRGPVTRRDGLLVMDLATAERYQPISVVGEIGVALARVRTNDDAVAFASKYGLLNPAWVDTASGQPVTPNHNFLAHLVLRFDRADWRTMRMEEPIESLVSEAAHIRFLTRWILDVRKAQNGDENALNRVRYPLGWHDQATHLDPAAQRSSDRDQLQAAMTLMTMGLVAGLDDAKPYVYDVADMFPEEQVKFGTLRLGIVPQSLKGFCYLSLIQQLSRSDQPLEMCPECGKYFVVRNGKQKFCEQACADRARWTRWKSTPAYATRAKKSAKKGGRGSRGKTTRQG